MFSSKQLFSLITVLTAICLYIALPSTVNLPDNQYFKNFPDTLTKRPISMELFGRGFSYDPQLKLGLDLQGGTHLVLEADMSEIRSTDRLDALESAQEVISRRVDAFGVAEPVIQTSVNTEAEQYRLIVELPGVSDVNQAIELVGSTALLEFREENPDFSIDEATLSGITLDSVYKATGLTGKQLQRSQIEFDPQTGKPVVGIEFDAEGSRLFGELTDRNVGKPIAVILDGNVVTAPVVNQPILDGRAVIQGDFDLEEAKNLAIQLNAGALPVPIQIISQRNVGASLGQVSIQQSMVGGIVGLLMVMLFMGLNYGILGLLANMALIIYGIITLALYKVLGVTLTLPGVAGFVLSVGMAVDANILIFERYKEEIRLGKAWRTAMELGFGRAWDSIKDANVATLIICFILFNPLNWNFLNSSGMVRGFALTLALGILISLFTGVVVTRTLIRLFYHVNQPKTV